MEGYRSFYVLSQMVPFPTCQWFITYSASSTPCTKDYMVAWWPSG